MTNSPHVSVRRIVSAAVSCAAVLLTACSLSGVLDVPPPIGVSTAADLTNKGGAEQVYNSAKAQFLRTVYGGGGTIMLGGMLTDELMHADHMGTGGFGGSFVNIDARVTEPAYGGGESGDGILSALLSSRSTLLIVAERLRQYETSNLKWRAGEAFALAGYAELTMAETYCAGVTLSRALPAGGYEYGMPLSTDSLFGAAAAHFDSALANAYGDSTVLQLAHVGLARARLGRGDFAGAASAAAGVRLDFVYQMISQPAEPLAAPLATNFFAFPFGCPWINVADRKGTNGLNFVSARDPRIAFDSTSQTCDGARFHYPLKFGTPSTVVALATGVEARLIAAEAALHAGQPGAWADTLNALRNNAASTYVQLAGPMAPLTADSTSAASDRRRIDVLFRERAFWLYGTGTRLGDLRRLLRLYKTYGYTSDTLYPVGPYPPTPNNEVATYGTDVSFTLPTRVGGEVVTNPNYRGCTVPTTQE